MATGTVTKPAVRSVWATSATAANIADPGDAFGALGWPLSATPPARQFFNWLDNYNFNGVRYQCARGLPDWDATETFYAVGSVVIGDNGLIYAALQAGPNAAVPGTNSNKTPSASPTYWGSVGVPTATAGDTSGKVASTAFVTGAVTTETNARIAAVNAEAAARAAAISAEQTQRAQGDNNTLAAANTYTNTKTAPLAPLISPAFSGSPTAPTPVVNNSGSAIATTAFVNPGSSVTTNGYQMFGSGLIIQWGVVTGPSTGASAVAMTFPLVFPNQCFSMTVSTKRGSVSTVGTGCVDNLSQTQGTLLSPQGAYVVLDRDDGNGPLRGFWMAIGH